MFWLISSNTMGFPAHSSTLLPPGYGITNLNIQFCIKITYIFGYKRNKTYIKKLKIDDEHKPINIHLCKYYGIA
jgi:hypothetical protein